MQHLLAVLWHLPAAEGWGGAEGQGQDKAVLPPAHPRSVWLTACLNLVFCVSKPSMDFPLENWPDGLDKVSSAYPGRLSNVSKSAKIQEQNWA